MAGWLMNLFGGKGSEEKKTGVSVDAPAPVSEDQYAQTESGLAYYDFTVGEGPSPNAGQQVTVHYTGWLTNGKRFDSSKRKGKPFTFEIGRRRVIKGWDEGVLSMQAGGIRHLKIPASLGYGAVGHPPVIPKNATLIFEIELLGIE